MNQKVTKSLISLALSAVLASSVFAQNQNQNQNQTPGRQGTNTGTSRTGQFPARSGQANYQTNNNQRTQSLGDPVNIGRAPGLHYGTGNGRDRDGLQIVPGGGGARIGYFPYSSNWRDRYFNYPFYVFAPTEPCFISPWYYYSGLPGYISSDRVIVLDNVSNQFSGTEYGYDDYAARQDAYQQGYQQGYQDGVHTNVAPQNRALNNALDDIKALYLNANAKSLDHLIPETGNVNIFVDGKYSYSLGVNDFYDLLADNAQAVKTTNFEILDVKVENQDAKVSARQTFTDAWGQSNSVYQTFKIHFGTRSASITEFGTSQTQLPI